MSGLDGEAGDAWLEPLDVVAGVAAIEWADTLSCGYEAEAVQDRPVEGWIEDLAEIAAGDGEPDEAVGAWRCAKGLLAARTWTGSGAGAARGSLDEGDKVFATPRNRRVSGGLRTGGYVPAPCDGPIVRDQVWKAQLDQSSGSPVN
jgi:hypothetical protein